MWDMVLDSKEITDDVNLATIPSWCPLPDAPTHNINDLNQLRDWVNDRIHSGCGWTPYEINAEILRISMLEDVPAPEQEQLAELWQFCLKNGVELHDDLIGYRGDDKFLLLKILKKIAELRGKK